MKVTEVAHDYHVGVQKYVTSDFGVLNSYDTWHGNDEFDLKHRRNILNRDKACGQGGQESGPARDEGKTWFIQLKDKHK